jgi:creatinine amidohydrolase
MNAGIKTWIPDDRQFAYLNWKQVEALDKEATLLVLPTAAIEQHGHHLPLATDTLINNLLLGKAMEKLPKDAPVYALPPICYGKSNEHIGFPGTMSVSAATFMAVVRDLGASVKASGFKRLVLYNTHGGNTSLADVMARDLRAEFGLRTFYLTGAAGVAFGVAGAGAGVWFPCGRGRDGVSAERDAGVGGHLHLYGELHRRCCEAGPAAAGEWASDV